MLAVRDAQDSAIKNVAHSFMGTDAQRIASFDKWERRYYRFRDEQIEIIRAPVFMLEDLATFGYLEGDCDDITTFSACVCIAMGLPCRFVAIRTDPSRIDYLHVFCETLVNGEWLRLDATVSPQTNMIFYGERMVEYVR
jgi:transglutaminase-like putative cysteine protease